MAPAFTRAQVFSTNLLSAMQRKNVSRRGLAKLIRPDDPELGRNDVRRALRGKHEPTAQTVQRYSDALEILPAELLPAEDDEQEAAEPMLDVALQLLALDASIANAQSLRAQLSETAA